MKTFAEHYTIVESTVQPAGDLSEPIEVGEIGYSYLQNEIDKVNKKAIKWGVAPLVLHVISTREIPYYKLNPWGEREQQGTSKKYMVSIQGKGPQVEGYTFIAKVEHISSEGNLLNFSPDSPVKNLPEIYRTIGGGCDVCGRNQERSNTYVLRLDKPDPKHFPNKKPGELIQSGSICLKRFLPGVSIERLIHFAEMLEYLRNARSESENDDSGNDYFTGARAKRVMPISAMVEAIVWVINGRGKYISKKAAADAGEKGEPLFSTAQEAEIVLNYRPGVDRHKPKIIEILEKNPAIQKQADEMVPQVLDWMKKTDFTKLNSDPNFNDFYYNLNLIAHMDPVPPDKIGYVSAAVNNYLRVMRKQEETKAKNTAQGIERKYLGKVGDKIEFDAKFTAQKLFPNAYGTTYLYNFETPNGDLVQWWASKDCFLEVGKNYHIRASIKIADVNKYTQQPTTTITRAKLIPI